MRKKLVRMTHGIKLIGIIPFKMRLMRMTHRRKLISTFQNDTYEMPFIKMALMLKVTSLCRMTLSRTTLRRMPLGRMPLSKMKHRRTTRK